LPLPSWPIPPLGGPARHLLNSRTGMSDMKLLQTSNATTSRAPGCWPRTGVGKASRLGRMATQQRRFGRNLGRTGCRADTVATTRSRLPLVNHHCDERLRSGRCRHNAIQAGQQHVAIEISKPSWQVPSAEEPVPPVCSAPFFTSPQERVAKRAGPHSACRAARSRVIIECGLVVSGTIQP